MGWLLARQGGGPEPLRRCQECLPDRVGVVLEVEGPIPGEVYRVFSESELKRLAAAVPWLKASERSFEFWENEEDAVHDGR